MDKKIPIRLTFYYADRQAYEFTTKTEIFRRLTFWATNFFEKYGFTLDMLPIPYSKELYEKKYILKEENGMSVRFELLTEALKECEFRDDKYLQLKDIKASSESNNDKKEKILEEIKEMDSHINTWTFLANSDCEYLMKQCFSKENYTRSKRLTVIFCYSNKVSNVAGYCCTLQGYHPFVLLNLGIKGKPYEESPFSRNSATLAHEIVHAAGHEHPPEGGEKDGSEFSVMNYNSHGYTYYDVILENIDVSFMQNAFFTT